MIFNVIIATAVVNIVLAVIAIAKGRKRLNLVFFVMSLLLAAWNVCIVLWKGNNIEAFSRINFLFVNMIPPAAVFLVLTLFSIPLKSLAGKVFYAAALLSVINGLYTLATFISRPAFDLYYSRVIMTYFFAYEFLVISAAFGLMLYYYGKIKFRQEKLKVFYVFIAFAVLFAGGMLDFTEGLGWHHLKYWGNLANTFYLLIIFYAVFRLRLLDAGVLFKNFLAYTVIGAIAGGCYTYSFLVLSGQPQVLIGVFFGLSMLTVYFSGKMHDTFSIFADTLAPETSVTEARKSFKYIREMNVTDEDMIFNLIFLLRDFFEIDVCVYYMEKGLFVPRWSTDEAVFRGREVIAVPGTLLVRYETGGQDGLMDAYNADILLPLTRYGTATGVLAGRKQTADISFLSEEIELIREVGASIASRV
jgi:hypothetical protein